MYFDKKDEDKSKLGIINIMIMKRLENKSNEIMWLIQFTRELELKYWIQ